MRFRLPDKTLIFTENARFSLDERLEYNDIKVKYELTDGKMKIYVKAECTPLRFLRLRWNYTSEERMTGIQRVLGAIHTVPNATVSRSWDSICPDKWLLNGNEISFRWIPDEGCDSVKTL